jgi:hypothetical protein
MTAGPIEECIEAHRVTSRARVLPRNVTGAAIRQYRLLDFLFYTRGQVALHSGTLLTMMALVAAPCIPLERAVISQHSAGFHPSTDGARHEGQ